LRYLILAKSIKVLIIDDELLICEDLKTTLEKAGCTVSNVAASGEQAIILQNRTHPISF
jgi:YesN/AraC family two-component response regulator